MTQAPILVGVDFSESGRRALKAATELASDLSTSLVLVHAYPSAGYLPALMGDAGTELIEEAHAEVSKDEALVFARDYVGWVRAQGVEAEAVASDGDPVDLIIEHAEAHQVGLIVVGTHGHTGLKKFIMGSVAEGVIKRSSRPVLVVPHKNKGA